MNLVDSSGWLEYLAGGSNADFFAPAIEDTDKLVVSTINLYEVFKRVYQQRGEDDALKAIVLLLQGNVVEVNTSIALDAARFSADHKLPIVDAVIYMTAKQLCLA